MTSGSVSAAAARSRRLTGTFPGELGERVPLAVPPAAAYPVTVLARSRHPSFPVALFMLMTPRRVEDQATNPEKKRPRRRIPDARA
ncbi:hypothetical protein GCM10023085_75350 [Actinomadura viridis]